MAVGLHHAAQAHVGTVSHVAVVVHDGAAVDQHALAQLDMGVQHGALHHKTAGLHLHRGADDRAGVAQAGHVKPRLLQLFHPGQTHPVVAEGRHSVREFLPPDLVIHAFADDAAVLRRVVQKGDLLVLPALLGTFIDHMAEAAGPKDQKVAHGSFLISFMGHRRGFLRLVSSGLPR